MQELKPSDIQLDVIVARQGDVALMPVAAIPRGERKKRADRCLAYGEVTGHAHRLVGQDVLVWEEDGFASFVEIGGDGAVLTHEEHEHIQLPPGRYKVIMQREADPFSDDKAWRAVLD